MRIRDWFTGLILVSLILLYFFLLAVPINLATADLGRHIKNGELLLQGNFQLLYQNYYSASYPDFPFVNHHWLGGVLFYLFFIVSGFTGVQLLFIVTNLIIFTLFFYIAQKYSNIYVSSIIALLIIPVLAYRFEVRPEVFSYLFAGIYYLILKGFLKGHVRKKWLYLLPVLQLVWVNTHVYFFAGFLILGVFWFEALVRWILKKDKSGWSVFKILTALGVLSSLVSLINPHFINGLIYPLTIFGNYGYRVLENQSVFFLENIIEVPVLVYFKMALGLLILSWIYKAYRIFRYKEEFSIQELILSVVFLLMALMQIRNLALFGLFMMPVAAINLKSVRLEMNRYLLFPALGIVFIALLVINPKYWEGRVFGLGLMPGMEQASDFFVKENIKGPIFNNYDIGGYLIFNLFPKEKVFVDNRPEAYPSDFFKRVYVPMQEDEEFWQAKSKEYNFNSIFVYRQDLTPWAQKFLVSRVNDPEWVPVFVDDYNIIFVKRNDQNQEIIKRFELPKEMFGVKKEE